MGVVLFLGVDLQHVSRRTRRWGWGHQDILGDRTRMTHVGGRWVLPSGRDGDADGLVQILAVGLIEAGNLRMEEDWGV